MLLVLKFTVSLRPIIFILVENKISNQIFHYVRKHTSGLSLVRCKSDSSLVWTQMKAKFYRFRSDAGPYFRTNSFKSYQQTTMKKIINTHVSDTYISKIWFDFAEYFESTKFELKSTKRPRQTSYLHFLQLSCI